MRWRKRRRRNTGSGALDLAAEGAEMIVAVFGDPDEAATPAIAGRWAEFAQGSPAAGFCCLAALVRVAWRIKSISDLDEEERLFLVARSRSVTQAAVVYTVRGMCDCERHRVDDITALTNLHLVQALCRADPVASAFCRFSQLPVSDWVRVSSEHAGMLAEAQCMTLSVVPVGMRQRRGQWLLRSRPTAQQLRPFVGRPRARAGPAGHAEVPAGVADMSFAGYDAVKWLRFLDVSRYLRDGRHLRDAGHAD